jgi:hypothetical protein
VILAERNIVRKNKKRKKTKEKQKRTYFKKDKQIFPQLLAFDQQGDGNSCQVTESFRKRKQFPSSRKSSAELPVFKYWRWVKGLARAALVT